jgi:putative SOS response-associated peptidase YedK
MCGRYALRISLPDMARILGLELGEIAEHAPRYNIAPTQSVPVLRQEPEAAAALVAMRWGLVPAWSKGPDNRYAMFNARLEGIAAKPAFRAPIRRRRAAVPTDGWYEWTRVDGGRQPHFIHRPNHGPCLFAGVWDRWHAPDGEPLESVSIITAPASGPPVQVHGRMPVLLDQDLVAAWLDPAQQDAEAALALLDPPGQAAGLVHEPVSRYANAARNEGPQCLEPG